MGYKAAGRGGPSTYLGDHVLTVAPAGQGAQFDSLQNAIDYASSSLSDWVDILLAPGFYDEDVILRRNKTGIRADIIRQSLIKSLTISDCTTASIGVFNGSGLVGDLVQDGALPPIHQITLENVYTERAVNLPVWHANAAYSFRVLGFPVDGGTFLDEQLVLKHSIVNDAAGGAGPQGMFLLNANDVVVVDCFGGGSIKCKNIGQLTYFTTKMFGTAEIYYDAADPEPFIGNNGLVALEGFMQNLVLSGPEGKVSFAIGTRFGQVDVNATGAELSTFFECGVMGLFNMPNVGPTVVFSGGRYMVPVVGAGAVGFTGNVGFNS